MTAGGFKLGLKSHQDHLAWYIDHHWHLSPAHVGEEVTAACIILPPGDFQTSHPIRAVK